MKFTVASAQFTPTKGAVESNLDRIVDIATEASKAGADLVVFPEACTTGYILEGGVNDCALWPNQLVEFLGARAKVFDRPVDLALGFYEQTLGQPYNSAAYLSITDGEVQLLNVYRKVFPPTYHVFDEERFHSAGSDLGLVQTKLGTLGVLICEDVWHSILGSLLAIAGAEMILVHSASPGRGFADAKPQNLLRYERMLQSMSEEHGLYAVISMLTGFEGGKGMTGGSMIFDPSGDLMCQAPLMEEALVMADIDLDQVRIARQRSPLLSDLRGKWAEIIRMVEKTKW
ncbi:MAG: hypothetical protein MUC92_01365 [Fimbriimonadaceae bacterium]|jgi:predicted amidohydrolase|nr:hypothetical protein [Fimbriimonadaceae bacterium]